MANRNLTPFREVTGQAVENKGQSLLEVGVDIADQIVRQGQEAKIVENLSNAEMEVRALENQYRIDNEGDPFGGLDKYKNDRKKIFDKYGGDISPLYGREWRNRSSDVAIRNDATQQAWGLKQTRVNTVNSINTNIKNSMSKAADDGRNFAASSGTDPEAFINYAVSRETIQEFGDRNLGSETTAGMLEGFDEDYMKSFLSGVSESDPLRAVSLMDNDTVKDSFSDQAQFLKMKDAMTARAKRFQKAQKSARSVGGMSAENSLIGQIGNMSYADLQQNFSEFSMSPQVQAFYEEVNGYASQRAAVKGAEKINLKRKFQTVISEALSKDDLTDGDLRLMQDAIYGGMNKKVLSDSEGFGYINELMQPLLEKKRANIDQFKTGQFNPFQENLGLDTLDAEIVQITGLADMPQRNIGNDDALAINETTNAMYDAYLGSLMQEAKSRDMTVADLSGLPFSEEKAIYDKALKVAKDGVLKSIYPSLANVEEMPATIIDGDRKINTGLSKGGATQNVKTPNTKIATDANGNKALVEVDNNGKILKVIKEIK